jgi:hypothetical protein
MGARGAVFLGGVLVAAVALLTVWRAPSVSHFSVEKEMNDRLSLEPRDLSAESIPELGGPPRG